MHLFIIAKEIATRLMEVTRRDIYAGDYGHVKEDFAFAEKWLREGSAFEKIAIANVFLYSISNTIDTLGRQGRKIQDLLPPLLKKEFLIQVYNRGV